MEFTDYFKKLYTGKDIWRKHILLFSVVGIMTLLLNNVTTSYANGFLLTNNLMVAPHALETIVDFIFGRIEKHI